jgi:hypothetical protein
MEFSAEDIRTLLSTIKNLRKQNDQLLQALLIGGQYARDNLPAAFPSDNTYVSIYAGGYDRDPTGREFANYWFHLAEQKDNS